MGRAGRRLVIGVALLAATAVGLAGCAAGGPVAVELPLEPRLQWLANDGYCGETALVTAALGLGTYVSQFTTRALASDLPQSDPGSQLLPGVNAVRAAEALHLTAEDWDGASEEPLVFAGWVRDRLLAGEPVILGAYENGSDFGEGGDPEFDHVLLAVGYRAGASVRGSATAPDDVLVVDDHGLWNPDDWGPDDLGATPPPFLFELAVGDAIRTREAADEPEAPTYSIPATGPWFATAITGIDDPDGETLPVSLVADPVFEAPVMVDGSDAPPAPGLVRLTATVSGLTAGTTYRVLVYDDFADVPSRDFGAADGTVSDTTFVAGEATRTLPAWTIPSDEVLVVRVVQAG